MMEWEQLLSLKRKGDTSKRLRVEEDETRLGFEVDYDRIVFSTYFRSLQDKTQVIPLSKTDFVHNRLTHSLEVSVVGRSLGRLVGKKILQKRPYLKEIHGFQTNDFGSIVAAACLAHDIGNPPFGHSGEKAIGEFFTIGNGKKYKQYLTEKEYTDLILFEGNANGFSIISSDREGVMGSLRLTYSTLGAFMKYPKESLPIKPTKEISDKKYGFFQKDKVFFEEVAQELGLISKNNNSISYKRHPLCYLVEAADDICYTIMDFEDGINLGWIQEEFALEYLINLVKDSIDTVKYKELLSKEDRLAYLRAIAINSLIQDAVSIFVENEEKILNGKFEISLMDSSRFKAQLNDIISISVQRIYQSTQVIEKEVFGYKILNSLLEIFTEAYVNVQNNKASNYDKVVYKLLPENFKVQKKTLYEQLIHICQFISLLSDTRANDLFKTLNMK